MSTSPSRRRAVFRACAFALPLLVSLPVPAEEVRDAILRRDLAVIQAQIEQIEVVVQRIEDRQAAHGPTPARVYLDTRQLRSDLERVAGGIDGFLEPPRLPPRDPLPLSGDYLGEAYR